MLTFSLVLREWWKGLNSTERQLMMETVFCPVGKGRRRAERPTNRIKDLVDSL